MRIHFYKRYHYLLRINILLWEHLLLHKQFIIRNINTPFEHLSVGDILYSVKIAILVLKLKKDSITLYCEKAFYLGTRFTPYQCFYRNIIYCGDVPFGFYG